MKIAIDVTPLQTEHKVRGTGFYLTHLKDALVKYFPKNDYIFFERGDKLPKDVGLVHFPYFEPFFLALPIYRRYKMVVTVHDLTPIVFPNAFPRGIKGELKWQMQKYALKKANAIITDSECSKNDVIKYVGINADSVNVVYLAAGEQFRLLTNGDWKAEIKEKYSLPERYILYVGDVTWNKNLPRLIDATKKLNIPLVMVGKNLVKQDYDRYNPWNQDLRRVNELANGDTNIIRLGFVDSDDLVGIYNLATVFVMPSLYEGFGLPILEAEVCGCPVICTKEGSLNEVAGNSVFFVDGYNVDSITSGIKEVFNSDHLRKELSLKGLENVKKFSWKKTAENTLRIYRQVLERK